MQLRVPGFQYLSTEVVSPSFPKLRWLEQFGCLQIFTWSKEGRSVS